MDVQVREFTPRDKHRLRSFSCALKKDRPYAKRVNYIIKKFLIGALNDRGFDVRAFAATDKGEIVGIAALGLTSKGGWELLAVGVSVHARRQGVGRTLLQAAVARTPECWNEPLIFTVHQDNREMQRLLTGFDATAVTAPDREGYFTMIADPDVVRRGFEPALANPSPSLGR